MMTDPTDSHSALAEEEKAQQQQLDDQELADKIVALGVITKDAFRHDMYSLQSPDGQFVGIRYEAKEIVRDWRVAGALMEKLTMEGPDKLRTVACSYHSTMESFEASVSVSATPTYGTYLARSDDSMPRAIIEACVETLDET